MLAARGKKWIARKRIRSEIVTDATKKPQKQLKNDQALPKQKQAANSD